MTEYFTKDGDDFKKVDETLMTQEDIETTFLPSRLERERKKFADYDQLKEKATKVDSITQEYEDKLKTIGTEKSDLEKQLGSAKLDTEKVKIMHEFKLSDDLAEFVIGDSAEDLRQRAEKLAKEEKPSGVVIDKENKPDVKETDNTKVANKLFKRQSD